MSNKKQYLIAGLILLVGILISAIILLLAFLPQGNEATAETTDDAITTETLAEYTVTFYDINDNVMQKNTVKDGETVLPPKIHFKTQIFKGWSEKLFWISGDTDAYPIVESLEAKQNAFYADAVYARSGGDVEIPVYIGGEVNLGDFTTEIYYDSKILQYNKIEGDSITAINDAETGCLTVKRQNGERLTAADSLFTLYFSASGEDGYESEILLRPKETFTLEDGEKVYVDSVAYNAKLYLLQIK